MITPHPCAFPDSTVKRIAKYLPPDRYPNVLDPFAGVGKIHALPQATVGIEIEPEWAIQYSQFERGQSTSIKGDALDIPFLDRTFSAVATSPCFGNRMADHHNAQDGSTRTTYRHKLGHELHPDSSAGMQWGPMYRAFHYAAWDEVKRVTRTGGRFVLNVKNHIRQGEIQRVAEWHMGAILKIGYRLRALEVIPAPGNRYGANHDLRVDHEFLMVFDLVHR